MHISSTLVYTPFSLSILPNPLLHTLTHFLQASARHHLFSETLAAHFQKQSCLQSVLRSSHSICKPIPYKVTLPFMHNQFSNILHETYMYNVYFSIITPCNRLLREDRDTHTHTLSLSLSLSPLSLCIVRSVKGLNSYVYRHSSYTWSHPNYKETALSFEAPHPSN